MNGRLDRETYIGHDAQHMRGVLALRHPIKNGIIRNWDDMEKARMELLSISCFFFFSWLRFVLELHIGLVCVFACSQIWQYTFRQLCVSSDEHPVMLTEAAMNPRENRQRMVEIMFESFNVPFTYVALQAMLALYAAGRTTGELKIKTVGSLNWTDVDDDVRSVYLWPLSLPPPLPCRRGV